MCHWLKVVFVCFLFNLIQQKNEADFDWIHWNAISFCKLGNVAFIMTFFPFHLDF